MFYVYVLKSTSRKFLYTGCTNDLRGRFREHNEKMVKSTSPYAPFDIIYYEASLSEIDAYRREKYLKTRLGKSYLRKRLKDWNDHA
ncbi:MAG: hypothetical protein A3B47_02540 [Candidatus Levybacteria bacterium RIFCSPLOWO2_01_FULL_39_24]|nr:MAG: hypothetical protein A2800_01835 [Candidatus Levybacteria bacterium RIFCSPHIGHO2_01_FULL_40_16]OGH28263.1 MAG: hypothetical protein A3E12_02015 [Candidatus Levybacteria bacterium RIFCSPHIGHO2_12_FULL_39_9]OGH46505.1 MAG: hypothetical protein A3B47_02540 [Candidatus Levybacteria bacterium RIFCSPLOWO2_01_FULL_39_24]